VGSNLRRDHRADQFRGSVDPLIEPAEAHCFQHDRCVSSTIVPGGHAVWTRVELAKAAQDNFRVALFGRCPVYQVRSISSMIEKGRNRGTNLVYKRSRRDEMHE
jgi:hypothetical protein